MFNELETQNKQLTRETKLLEAQVQTLRKQVLENEIANLEKLSVDNLSIGQDLLEKGIVDNINSYLENNQRIERKIAELRAELAIIEQQLNEQLAQQINQQ